MGSDLDAVVRTPAWLSSYDIYASGFLTTQNQGISFDTTLEVYCSLFTFVIPPYFARAPYIEADVVVVVIV